MAPWSMARSTPSTARFEPNCLTSPCASTASVSVMVSPGNWVFWGRGAPGRGLRAQARGIGGRTPLGRARSPAGDMRPFDDGRRGRPKGDPVVDYGAAGGCWSRCVVLRGVGRLWWVGWTKWVGRAQWDGPSDAGSVGWPTGADPAERTQRGRLGAADPLGGPTGQAVERPRGVTGRAGRSPGNRGGAAVRVGQSCAWASAGEPGPWISSGGGLVRPAIRSPGRVPGRGPTRVRPRDPSRRCPPRPGASSAGGGRCRRGSMPPGRRSPGRAG